MRAIKLLLILLICAVPAMADNIWDVTGALTIVGNNVCGGPPCVETVAFSFDLEYQPLPPTFPPSSIPISYNAELLPGATTTSFGPLAPFSVDGLHPNGPGDYVAFVNAAGDQIDLVASSFLKPFAFFGSPTPGPPGPFGADLYACGRSIVEPICEQDFVPPDRGGATAGIFLSGTVQSKVTAVPEGSTLSYVTFGFILLGAIGLVPFLHQRRCPLTGFRCT